MLASDLVAASIVTIMLIPQSLAYALIADLPVEVGLYSAILPLIVYAVFGTSRTLSVAPAAIASLMTASALSEVSNLHDHNYLAAAIMLAMLSGIFLLLFGILKLGFLSNFLSHPLISGFITASAVLISLSQVGHLLGIQASGSNIIEIGQSLLLSVKSTNLYTLAIGGSVLVFLYVIKSSGETAMMKLGMKKRLASLCTKSAPAVSALATLYIVYVFGLEDKGVLIVNTIPVGLPSLSIPDFNLSLIKELTLPAIFISIVGYVESVAIGKTLAEKRGEKINNNQELIGLGNANIASAISGGFPVTGSLSRSMVNNDAGAVTQVSGIFAAIGVAAASLFLTPVLFFLPKATLAATIIIAVSSLIDFSVIKKIREYEKSDYYTILVTILLTLFLGVEAGIMCGVILSIYLHLHRTSKPHIAKVGLLEGTEYFKNVKRHSVITDPRILTLRPDESLIFSNANYVEDSIYDYVRNDNKIAHVVIMCSAVNQVDYSALETLEKLSISLFEKHITLHLSEVKGPVLDALNRVEFNKELSGNIYFSQFEAFNDLKET